MFIGQSGVGRIIERTCAAMREAAIDDPHDIERVRALGVHRPADDPEARQPAFLADPRPVRQRDQHQRRQRVPGRDQGRYLEDQIDDDHVLAGATYPVLRLKDGRIAREDVPALSALNMRLRDDYVADASSGVERWWNRIIARAGIDYRLTLPHVAFNRRIGEFAAIHADPEGRLLGAEEWRAAATSFCRPPQTIVSSPG